MTQKIFFSFHYERDAWRAAQVRNCDLIPNEDEYGFVDAVEWEKIEREGDAAIERWIAGQMSDTSVTVVLIGAETASRKWVRHEIMESWKRGNAILGITIHNIKDQDRNTDSPGENPLDHFQLSDGRLLSEVCETYDWVSDDGRNNLGTWAEEAYTTRKKIGSDLELTEVASVAAAAGVAASAITVKSRGFVPRAPWSATNAE